jgi:hypothetical protein
MKKAFLFFAFFALVFCVYSQKNNDEKILISGFDGDKPLKEDGLIVVVYPNSPEDYYLVPAYKWETKNRFLRRITLHENFKPSLDSKKISKDSVAVNKVVVVGELPPANPMVWVLLVIISIPTIIVYLIMKRREKKVEVE